MIKSFKLFESHSQIESICNRYGIGNWEINPETGLVDVTGDVDLSEKKLRRIPIKFGRVGGSFRCYNNQLTSLEGSPRSVGGDFYCDNNQLTSLEGSPRSVGGYFGCRNNKIRDFLLPYASLNESRTFLCEGNPIFEIYQLFNDPKCIDIINEWGILDGEKIVRIRLEEVFLDMGLEVPERLKFKEWEVV